MAEEQICGDVQVHGGEFEWVCVLPPHGEGVTLPTTTYGGDHKNHFVRSHYYRAFKKVA